MVNRSWSVRSTPLTMSDISRFVTAGKRPLAKVYLHSMLYKPFLGTFTFRKDIVLWEAYAMSTTSCLGEIAPELCKFCGNQALSLGNQSKFPSNAYSQFHR